jgi:hypothetical protein
MNIGKNGYAKRVEVPIWERERRKSRGACGGGIPPYAKDAPGARLFFRRRLLVHLFQFLLEQHLLLLLG